MFKDKLTFLGAVVGNDDCSFITNVGDGNYKGIGKWIILNNQYYEYQTYISGFLPSGFTQIATTTEGYKIYQYSSNRIVVYRGDNPVYFPTTTSNLQQYIQECIGCTPSWSCGSWSSCTNNLQTRTCTDSNNCGVTTGKPVESQSCTPECPTCNSCCPADITPYAQCNSCCSSCPPSTYCSIEADTNKDAKISYDELLSIAQIWVTN